jgi:hypothetical protein
MTSEFIRTEWNFYKKSLDPSMRKWSRVIKSYEDVPAGFQEVFPESAAQFPYTVLVPEEQLSPFSKKRNATLVSLYDDRLVILEAIRGKVRSTDYPLDAITHLEHGKVLLKSWLKVSMPSKTSMIKFNTASEQVFTPVIEGLRATESVGETVVNYDQELSKLGYLWKINFKYFNLSRKSILPGSKIVETVYQPDICLTKRNIFRQPVFNKFQTGHLTILTEEELIHIKEDTPTRSRKERDYGSIVSYIPLDQIQHVSFEHTLGKVDCSMNITLADNTSLRSEFFTTTAMNLELFKEACATRFPLKSTLNC